MNYRILVVDDEKDILTVICSVLEKCGHDFITEGFTSPVAALDRFRANPEAFDLVLTDIRMPRMLGFEMALQMQKIRPAVRVAFMSAFDIDERIPGYSPTVRKEDVIYKPSGIFRLCQRLEKFFASSA
ncbi:MAG: response regulator [Nitrososphaera sp.]